MTFLVDSDVVADYLKGRADAVSRLQSLAVEGLAISILTYGEIYEGVLFGSAPKQEAGFRNFLRVAEVLSLNRGIMHRFAEMRGALRQQGRLIGDMDLLIAATALHHEMTLITRNRRHFERITGLQLHH